MNRKSLPLLFGALSAATAPVPPAKPALSPPALSPRALSPPTLSPNEIVATAMPADWVDISSADLLVMTLAPDARGKPRRVIIQLMPAPISQGWAGNMRVLAKAHWYDGIAIVRVQDNYVVQWGDPDGEDAKKAKPLPAGLKTMTERDYVTPFSSGMFTSRFGPGGHTVAEYDDRPAPSPLKLPPRYNDPYARLSAFVGGFPVAFEEKAPPGVYPQHFAPDIVWPIHCYGMVGVGRNLSPDTGTGAELYTVIGHAPRQLDRNIALVGRIVEGMEHLSSLPRGTGEIGFYKTAAERTPLLSVRLASDLPTAEQPRFQYLSTESDVFTRYADARANRRDPFFIVPAGGADICNIPVPIRRRP